MTASVETQLFQLLSPYIGLLSSVVRADELEKTNIFQATQV